MKTIFMALIAMLALACKRYEKNMDDKAATDQSSVEALDKTVTADTVIQRISNNAPVVSKDWERKIIKTANLQMELKNFDAYNRNIHLALSNYGAYVANEQQSQTDYEISNTISIRVPVDQFDALMNYLSAIDKDARLLDKQVTTEDVSTQVVDAKSRIETKKKLRDKYFELMGNSKKMDEVIRVQNEISSVTEDIEAAASKVQYMSRQSAYSTINLKYFQVLNATAPKEDDNPSYGISLTAAFKSGASFIGSIVLFLVNIWPLLLIAFAGWYFLRKKFTGNGSAKQNNIQNVQGSNFRE